MSCRDEALHIIEHFALRSSAPLVSAGLWRTVYQGRARLAAQAPRQDLLLLLIAESLELLVLRYHCRLGRRVLTSSGPARGGGGGLALPCPAPLSKIWYFNFCSPLSSMLS